MADALAVALHASGAETADGTGATAVDIGTLRTCLELLLDVTAVTGTFAAGEGLTVTVETSPDGTTGWQSVGTFTVAAAIGSEKLFFGGCREYVRVSWALTGSGSPSFTFSVSGDAHVLYAEPEDIDGSINAVALQSVSDQTKLKQLLRATGDVDASLNSAYEMPLTAWGPVVRGMTADRAMFYCVESRGFDPDNPSDQLIILKGGVMQPGGGRTSLQKQLDDIAAGRIKPREIVDSTPDTFEGGGFVISDTART